MIEIAGLIALHTCGFVLLDTALKRYSVESPYYLLHSLHNAVVVAITAADVKTTIFEYDTLWGMKDSKNWFALQLIFALHLYHILMYWRTCRFDDWLHHGVMIGLTLPLGVYLDSGPLLGFSLFFITGLPGCIDYALLFLQRNHKIRKETEKRMNCWLNTWIRAPGCVSHAILTTVYTLRYYPFGTLEWSLGLLIAAVNYWNGQYFLAQVVYDAGFKMV